MITEIKFGLRFGPRACKFLDAQTHSARSKLIDDVAYLRQYPYPYLQADDSSIVPFIAPPAVMRKWSDACHWIIYRIVKPAVGNPCLVIVNIGCAEEPPSIYR